MPKFTAWHLLIAIVVSLLLATALPAIADDHLTLRQWQNGEIDQVKMDAAAAKDNAETAKNNAVEVATDARNRFAMVTADMRATIDDAVDEVQRTISEANEGRDAFLAGDCGPGSPCDRFRTDLLGLIDDIEALQAEMAATTSLETRVDFSRMREIMADLPGRPLYPIYRSLVEELGLFESGFPEALRDLAADLPALRTGVEPAGDDGSGLPDPTTCESILGDPNFERKARGVLAASGLVKLTGKGLIALGETTLEGSVGADGYLQATVKNNWRKSLGAFLDGTADFGLSFSSWAHNKLRYCRLLDGQHGLSEQLEGAERRDMEALVSTCTPLTSAILPNEEGGEPTVYTIVDESIAAWEAHGLDVGKAAKHRADATKEFAEGDYAKAFEKLCKAYDEVSE